MSSPEVIAKFEAFDAYDFEQDEKFKSGVASLLNNKQENEAELLEKAKLFYYTKIVDSFNLDEYRSWKKTEVGSSTDKKTETENDAEKPPRFSFQELVDMIEKGIEIPGIKQIPNVINEGEPSKAKLTARPKPWEIKKEDSKEV